MMPEDWNDGNAKCLAMLMSGSGITDVSPRGQPVHDDEFLMLFNAHHDDMPFVLPNGGAEEWRVLLDTAREPAAVGVEDPAEQAVPEGPYPLVSRSFALLTRRGTHS